MLKILKDRVAIEPLGLEEQTEGGIFIPQNFSIPSQSEKARVVAMGPKVEGLKVGDIVLYFHFAARGEEIIDEGKTIKIVNVLDIFCVLEGE